MFRELEGTGGVFKMFAALVEIVVKPVFEAAHVGASAPHTADAGS